MTTSKIVAALAVVMAASFSTLTLNAKRETKDANAPTETTTQTMYYWFQADASGSLTSRVAKSNSASELDPQCQGSGDICGLAYVASDTEINGSGQRVLKSSVTESSSQAESHEQ